MRSLSWSDYVRLALSYAVFTRNDDGSWSVEIPVLPGCVTWGQTRAEVAEMAEDAIHGWLVISLRFGDPIPIIDGYTLGYLNDQNAETEMVYAATQP